MRKNDFSKVIRLSVICVLLAAVALCMFSCGGTTSSTQTTDGVQTTEAPANSGSEGPEVSKYTITVTVIDDKGESEDFEILTNAENLGDALLEANLVEGEMGDYGLYIKSVNGIRADYELDGAYWSLSKGGETLMTGASDTPIADGDVFELTYAK